MKNRLASFVLVAFVCTLVGCGSDDAATPGVTPQPLSEGFLGNWQTGCAALEQSPGTSSNGVHTMNADGTAVSEDSYYGNPTCAGAADFSEKTTMNWTVLSQSSNAVTLQFTNLNNPSDPEVSRTISMTYAFTLNSPTEAEGKIVAARFIDETGTARDATPAELATIPVMHWTRL